MQGTYQAQQSRGHSPAQVALVVLLYGLGALAVILAFALRVRPLEKPVHALARAQHRGEVAPQLPRLDADDAMANAAILNAALQEVAHPGLTGGARPCTAHARTFAVMLKGQLSRVRFGARSVCQLQLLKAVSVAQPGLDPRAVAEVAAFVLGRRVPGGADVDVVRLVVPPFRPSGDQLFFHAADLGALADGEQFIGTYHTHPGDDLDQGVLSETDLEYMRTGLIDFAGTSIELGASQAAQTTATLPTGRAASPARMDWLFDIVDPRHGDWNVYAHDRERLSAMADRCRQKDACPLNELRLAGSPFHLAARTYEEHEDDWP